MHIVYTTLHIFLQCYLTCTVDSISSIARVASAGETSLRVCAVCILVTVVLIALTLINVCIEVHKMVNYKIVLTLLL